MGTDIGGWVEYGFPGPRPDTTWWNPIISIECLPSGNYDMFACLFGVRNYAHFKPIATQRGIPIDVSYTVRRDLETIANAEWRDEFYSYTWITWQEIKNINWEEEAEELDERVHMYKRDEDGKLVRHNESHIDLDKLPPEAREVLRAGKAWERGDEVFKLEKMRRKDALDGDWEWELLFEMMELLAKRYGNQNVRMVVWFHD